jgi:hypothetical protein
MTPVLTAYTVSKTWKIPRIKGSKLPWGEISRLPSGIMQHSLEYPGNLPCWWLAPRCSRKFDGFLEQRRWQQENRLYCELLWANSFLKCKMLHAYLIELFLCQGLCTTFSVSVMNQDLWLP